MKNIFAGIFAGSLAFVFSTAAVYAGSETVLYSFCTHANCPDGRHPVAGLILDSQGSLYGTTEIGGNDQNSCGTLGCGTVFRVTPQGQEIVLYGFGGGDGENPTAGLIADALGNLYGTTSGGGANNGGTVFEVTPKGEESILYSFCSHADCSDGGSPFAGLIADAQGNLYGTTSAGGAKGGGTVFKVTPKGKETVLYSFCSQAGCSDGKEPAAGLIADAHGNLYGTTELGGSGQNSCSDFGCGTVFKVTPNGEETVLYSFCSQADCNDGSSPLAGLIADAQGNVYGTTELGGSGDSGGTVFKVTLKGNETVLYSFCSQAGCTDGKEPAASLIADAQGNVYGTTELGGSGQNSCSDLGCGTVFRVTPKGKETVLYSFCSKSSHRVRCIDGAEPVANLVADAQGNLYGTTLHNGGTDTRAGDGTVFKLDP